MPRIAYKHLVDGKSPYQKMKWPLPRGNRPGRWVEVEGQPSLCKWGLHGYREIGSTSGEWYEMELDGVLVEDGHKIAGTRARLVRKLKLPMSPRDARTIRRGRDYCFVVCPCGKECEGRLFGRVDSKQKGDAWVAFRRHWSAAHGPYPFLRRTLKAKA